MRILVTGGAGFIGSHLCKYLLEKGENVIAVDNLITGTKANIKELQDNSRFEFIEENICNSLSLEKEINQIYNLASPASPIDYQQKPIETLEVGSIGVKNMLELAVKNNATFLQASTSEVYGDPNQHPQTEDYWGNVNPVGIRSCYDEAKRYGEALVMAYHRVRNVDTRIVRLFNTYGPQMRKNDGRVVSNFINQALNKEPLTVYGDGSQTRSFCYIDDMVLGFHKAMNSAEIFPINLGNPSEHTILGIAKLVKELTNSKSEIVHKELPEDDPVRRKPDIYKAKKLLNWEPKITLKEGLEKTIEYFKSH